MSEIQSAINKVTGFITSAGVPADCIRVLLLIIVFSRFFSIQRKRIHPAAGIAFGVGGAIALLTYGPFREMLNYAINLLNGVFTSANLGWHIPML